ncbi:hypothetical protein [Deferribacter abyssi]|uniref:hypothetical protein n=1 Tax=Deferribacter abyssi TaxID=213806 RepID=UPI003C1CF080
MKVLNVEKFRNSAKVLIGGKEYEVRGISVGQFAKDLDVSGVQMPDNERMKKMRNLVLSHSNIPENVIDSLDESQLVAIYLVMRGFDPEELEKKMEMMRS